MCTIVDAKAGGSAPLFDNIMIKNFGGQIALTALVTGNEGLSVSAHVTGSLPTFCQKVMGLIMFSL